MILITGGTGLVGTHLIKELFSRGIKPRALYRTHIPEVVKDKADWIVGDILDVVGLEEALHGIQQVYHVAGFVSFSPKHQAAMHKINIEGTANVVNACLDAGVYKLVHVSSVAALGRLRADAPIDESKQWTEETSNSEYGRTKYLGELEVWRGISEGLQAAIVNPTIVIGEHGDWTKGSMNIFRNIHKGFKWFTTGSTGFVDADDVAKAMITIMESDVTAQRYVISGDNVTYQNLFNMAADAFGVKRPATRVTPLISAIVWRFEKIKSFITGADPLITKESANTGMAVVTFNNKKFLEAFPNFRYTPISVSVKRICASLKTQHG
jgi:nucleoside-diphosphate-sugar epimerase